MGAVLVILVAVIVTMKFGPKELQLNPNINSQFVSFFIELTAIALFVERALEVLVMPWREKEAQMKDVAATAARGALKAHLDQTKAATLVPEAVVALASKLPDLQQNAQDSAQELAECRAETQKIAFVASLAVGITVSLIGFRALDFLVKDGAHMVLAIHRYQLLVFQSKDMVLTGALISGGADGLHQMVTIFYEFCGQHKRQDQRKLIEDAVCVEWDKRNGRRIPTAGQFSVGVLCKEVYSFRISRQSPSNCIHWIYPREGGIYETSNSPRCPVADGCGISYLYWDTRPNPSHKY